MASPASSPPKSTTASSSSSMLLQPQCVCSLQEIIDQRQNEEEYVRFQCLAHTRFGRSPIQRRCGASFKLQVRPQVFERAKDYLRRTSPISILDYLQFVVRILFCRTHSESNAYRKFQDLLQKHWTGEGTPKETLLLDAIRKAFQLPPLAIVQMHNAREGFSSSPKSSKLGFLGPDMQPQTYAKSSETDQISRASLEAAQSTSSIDSSSLERKTLLPKPPSQRVKSVSHPAKQRDECIALPKPSSILAAENAHNIPFTLQQIKSKPLEGPELRQKATSSSSKSIKFFCLIYRFNMIQYLKQGQPLHGVLAQMLWPKISPSTTGIFLRFLQATIPLNSNTVLSRLLEWWECPRMIHS